jgi:hypothetical protein
MVMRLVVDFDAPTAIGTDPSVSVPRIHFHLSEKAERALRADRQPREDGRPEKQHLLTTFDLLPWPRQGENCPPENQKMRTDGH